MRQIQNSPSNITNFFLAICECILLLAFTNSMNHTIYSIGIMACIGYLVYYSTWFSHFKGKFNYYTIFLSFTLIFYFGQFILLLLGVQMLSGRSIQDNRLPMDSIIHTGVFIINAMTCFHIGVLLSTMKSGNSNTNNYEEKRNSLPKNEEILLLKRTGILVLIVSFLPSLSVLLENISITLFKGYGAIFQSELYLSGGLNNIRKFLSLFTVPALMMLIIAYRNEKKLTIVKLLIVIYLVMDFMSGSRITGVILFAALVMVFHYWYKPINAKTVLGLIGIGCCLLIVTSTISSIRNILYLEENKAQAIIEGLQSSWKQNPLFLSLEEAGFSFLTTGTILKYSPSVVPHQYGLSYLKGLWMLIPNIFWKVHPAASSNTDLVFSPFLTQYGGIGSSFIAEAYWNFSYAALVLMVAFGSIIGIITKKLSEYAKNGNAIKFFLMIYTGKIILTYVRSDTISFWRNFIYYGVFPLVFVYILTRSIEGYRIKANRPSL